MFSQSIKLEQRKPIKISIPFAPFQVDLKDLEGALKLSSADEIEVLKLLQFEDGFYPKAEFNKKFKAKKQKLIIELVGELNKRINSLGTPSGKTELNAKLMQALAETLEKVARVQITTKCVKVIQQGKVFNIYFGKDERKILGKGGFAKVKIAQDSETGKWSAWKVITSKLEKAQADFKKNEVKILKHLNQVVRVGEDIIHIERFSPSNKQIQNYVMMKLASGISLIDLIEKNIDIPPVMQLRIILNTLQAAEWMYQQGIIHRDHKPDNIMINLLTGEVKIVDVGLSRFLVNGKYQTENACGSQQYVPPEIITQYYANENYKSANLPTEPYVYHQKTDAYSIGICIAAIANLLSDKLTVISDQRIESFKEKEFSHETLKKIAKQCRKLMDVNPITRATFADSIESFKLLLKQLSDQERIIKVAILTVEDAQELLKKDNKHHLQEFFNQGFYRIHLITHELPETQEEFMKLMRVMQLFERYYFAVDKKAEFYEYDSKESELLQLSEILRPIQAKDPDVVYRFYKMVNIGKFNEIIVSPQQNANEKMRPSLQDINGKISCDGGATLYSPKKRKQSSANVSMEDHIKICLRKMEELFIFMEDEYAPSSDKDPYDNWVNQLEKFYSVCKENENKLTFGYFNKYIEEFLERLEKIMKVVEPTPALDEKLKDFFTSVLALQEKNDNLNNNRQLPQSPPSSPPRKNVNR